MKVDVIMVKSVPKCGNAGDIVKTKRGYAMNYLIPNKLAILATVSNVAKLEHDRKHILYKAELEKKAWATVAEKINAVKAVFIRKVVEEDKLYGSVTPADIKEYLESQGIKIERRCVKMDDHLKHLGQFEVKIALANDVEATLNVEIKPEEIL